MLLLDLIYVAFNSLYEIPSMKPPRSEKSKCMTFNSLYEILKEEAKEITKADVYFQFSLWDS